MATFNDYTATASQTDFVFSFPYLEDEHVTVEINGVTTTEFTIVTSPAQKVVLNIGATAGDVVRVRRKSQPDTNLVDFVNGSVLTESELDRAYQHNRFLVEEVVELNDASLQKEAGGTDWNAGGSKIKNLGTPTLTTDASTKNYVDAKVNQVSSGASNPPTKWVFTGTAGANTTYSVTGAEVLGDTAYDVSINGAVKEPTTDFTVDPDTDTLTIVSTLSGSEDIVVIERGFGLAISTGAVGEAQLIDNAVTYAKMQDAAADNIILGNDNGAGSDLQELTAAEVRTILNVEDAANNYSHPNHTGDVTSTGDGATVIANNAVTSAKISDADSNFSVQTNGDVGIGNNAPNKFKGLFGGPNALTVGGSVNGMLEAVGPCAVYTNFYTGIGGLQFLNLSNSDTSGTFTANSIFAGGIFGQAISDTTGTNPNQNAGGTLRFYTKPVNGVAKEVMKISSDGHVGIGTGNVPGDVEPAAPLEVKSTTGGVILPRLTTTEMNAVSSPTNGEMIYNTTLNKFYGYANGVWVALH
jgi:hypothetical protein